MTGDLFQVPIDVTESLIPTHCSKRWKPFKEIKAALNKFAIPAKNQLGSSGERRVEEP
jgi:hypothetical protein